MNTLSFNDEGY